MTDTSYAQIPAGWYPDPRGSKQRRWWDGSSWTHALEALPESPGPAAPAYANLPGPSVSRTPSPSAPTVARALDAEPTEHFPTRRQLRDAQAVIETQKAFLQAESGESYPMGSAVSATQKPHASFSIEQFRNAVEQTPTEHLTKDASDLTKSPAISTASSSPVSSASLTGSPVSAVPQTHTFSAQAARPKPAVEPVATTGDVALATASVEKLVGDAVTSAPVSAVQKPAVQKPAVQTPAVQTPAVQEPAVQKSAAPKTFDASEFTNPVIPVNPAAQAAKALAAATAAAEAAKKQSTKSDSKGFVPVMRTGASPALQNDLEYQPFGMTPRITTGALESPTGVNTGSVWALTAMPVLFLGVAFALIEFAPEFYTTFIQGGLAFVVVIASFALAIRDRQQLTIRSHRSTASPAWIFLTPLAYLVARAVHTKKQVGKGWAPALVFLLVVLACAAGVYFAPLPITAFFAVSL